MGWLIFLGIKGLLLILFLISIYFNSEYCMIISGTTFVFYSLAFLGTLLGRRIGDRQNIINNISANKLFQSSLNNNPCNDFLVKKAVEINCDIDRQQAEKKSIWGIFISNNVYDYKFIDIPVCKRNKEEK